MSNTTRKHVWPVSLMIGVAVIAMVAMMVAFAASPGSAAAQAPPPPPPPTGTDAGPTGAPPPPPPPATPEPTPEPNQAPMAIDGANMLSMAEGTTRTLGVDQLFEDPDEDDTLSITDAYVSSGSVTVTSRAGRVTIMSGDRSGESMVTVMAEDSHGASASITITVTVEDDSPVTVPIVVMDDAIESSSTTGGSSVKLTLTIGNPGELTAGSSVVLYLEDDFQVGDIDRGQVYFVGRTTGRVYVTDSVAVDDDDHFGGDDDWDLRIYVPDMNPGNDTGFDDWSADDAKNLRLVLDKAGVKNPTEAGSHSVGYTVLAPGASVPEFDADNTAHVKLSDLETKAKISLSDEDAGRGKEITITGTGFNNGVGAEARVLVKKTGDAPSCMDVMTMGEKLGEAVVGSDDKFTITFTVHQDEFDGGKVNYICAADSEAGNPRFASAVKEFELEASVSVSPTSASYGDEITLKPRDFGGDLSEISLGATCTWTAASGDTDCFTPTRDGSDYVFDLPGGLDASIQIAVKGPGGSPRKTTSLSVEASTLKLSQSEVAPNASVIISGSGFTENSTILVSNITIDDEPLVVDNAGTEGSGATRHVKTTSSGEFSATVRVWTASSSSNNPTLDDDTYTIKVVDQGGFEGEADVTILEPTLTVTPETASPRDFIVISGENWPISTADQDNSVTITVDGRTRNADIGSTGRFRYEYQLRSTIKIGDEHEVTAIYEDGERDDIEEDTTFNVAPAEITITPAAAGPGQTISIGIQGMPPYTLVDHVRIDGADRLGGRNVNTDREGDATVSDILVPFLDPGFYPVEVKVGNETRVAQFEVLTEAGVPGVASTLPDAVSGLGDSLEAIFHFNNTSKEWTFFDPRPEFADLNTLTELHAGQPYWVLVDHSHEDVDWNGRLVDFTCAADDCWNLEIW